MRKTRRPSNLNLPRDLEDLSSILIADLNLNGMLLIRLNPRHLERYRYGNWLLRREPVGNGEAIPAAAEKLEFIVDDLGTISQDDPLNFHQRSLDKILRLNYKLSCSKRRRTSGRCQPPSLRRAKLTIRTKINSGITD